MVRPAARLLLVLAACTAACGASAAASGNMPKAGPDEQPAPTKEVCVDTEDLELIKEGMMLVYGNQDQQAADYFRAKCFNSTQGELKDHCTCFYWAFRAHSAVNDTEASEAALEGALGLAGHDSQLLALKGELLTRAENFEEAARYFKLAATWHAQGLHNESESEKDSQEKRTKLYYNAATAYVQVRMSEEALEMYGKVIETEHGNSKWAVHNSMGLIYYDLEQDEAAIQAFEKALELESDHTGVLRNLAGVYLRQGNATAALPLLRISALREPDSFAAWYYLGAAFSQLQRHRDAAYAFGNATALNPNHTEARRFLGEECAQIEDFACAISELKEAARLLSLRTLYGGCDVYSALGATYMELSLFEQARSTFQAVLVRCDCANHPSPQQCAKDPMLLVDLGLAELALGDAAAANASLSAAVELDAAGLADQGVMTDLLWARAQLGDVAAAAEARLLMSQDRLVVGTPMHAVALGLPAAAHAQVLGDFVSLRRDMARGSIAGGVLSQLAVPPERTEHWLPLGAPSSVPMLRLGILVCSTALRGADMQALKYTLLSASAAAPPDGLEVVVFDWCVVGRRRGIGNVAVVEDEDEEEGAMSVMEEIGSDVAAQVKVREGDVGFQASIEAARIINAERIQVLVTLDGWNAANRNAILFHRPSPVQVGALGHRATMGDAGEAGMPPMVDAIVAGRVTVPPEHATNFFSEGLVVLPLGYMPPCPARVMPGAVGSLPALTTLADETGSRANEQARQRAGARQAWGVGESHVAMAVFGPVEAVSRVALSAWGAAHPAAVAAGSNATICLPPVHAQATSYVLAEIASYGSGEGQGRGGGSVTGWHVDVSGDNELNVSMRIRGADVLLDTWHVSSGPVLGKAVSEGLDVLTMPQDTMASRTGSEHAVALECARCAMARSPDEAAEYAAALAKTAAKAKPASGAVRKGLEHGPSVTRWCVQFIRGLRLLLEARMAAGHSDQSLPWGKAMQVVVSA